MNMPQRWAASAPLVEPDAGEVFIAAMLRTYAVPRRGRIYPSFHLLLTSINTRWPGIVDRRGLMNAMRDAGLGWEELRQFRTKGMRCLNFDLAAPVERWRVPPLKNKTPVRCHTGAKT